MNYIEAVFLGIIEGVTEFLPISSTAHLILGAHVLGIEQTNFVKSFEIIIQLGAILAVIVLYYKSFFDLSIIKKIFIGFIPTALFGLLVYKEIKEYLGDINIVLWSLFVGGVLLIIFEKYQKSKIDENTRKSGIENISIKESLIIGLCQCVAFIPGVSRSGATIIGGMSLGISRATIAEYSFLLAVPTMIAASGLDILKNSETLLLQGNFGVLFIGFIVSFFVALLAIKTFVAFLKKHDFVLFGIYRILIAIIFFLFVI